MNTPLLTVLAMTAFAANSLLCRAALLDGSIDAASFTAVRLAAGALLLALLLRWPRRRALSGGPAMATGLLLYMVGFSFAYRSLDAATGALLLFGSVQLTMLGWALLRGARFGLRRWSGFVLAFGGLVYLLLPGITAPDPLGAGLMVAAGIGWGAYSLLGRGSGDPLADTAGNFLIALLPALALLPLAPVVTGDALHVSGAGLGLAVASGALASGVGYWLWYTALAGLDAGRAATVQLSVPVLAALGGVGLLQEPLSPRLVIAAVVTLGGIWLALARVPAADAPESGR